MKKFYSMILAGVTFITACTPKEGIEVRDAWTRAAAQSENGAVYFIIHNYSDTDDALVGISTEVSGAVEFHESEMAHDVMQMRMVHSVPLASGEDVNFAPGGLHIMLVNLREELNVGERVEITLHFQNNPDISLSVPVQISEDHRENDD